MSEGTENSQRAWLAPWVRGVQRHAQAATLACLGITLLCAGYAFQNLGVNSDNPRMMPKDMPTRIHFEAFEEVFPSFENVLVVVVDGETPEVARKAATTLADALRTRPTFFHDVHLPGAGDFFEQHGLLYQPLDDLELFSEQIVTIQPLLASLEREPSLANLVSLIEEGLDATGGALDSPDEWGRVLDRFSDATVTVYSEYPLAISWEDLTLEGTPVDAQTRYTLIVEPVLDFAAVFPAERPMLEVHRVTEELGLVAERGVQVRITGHPALNHEEMQGVILDIVTGTFLFLGLVLFVLYRALSSVRMVIAALITLVCGLLWTTAFAAFAVGDLSLASLTFAIFFVGLGVDFTIHLGMAYASAISRGITAEAAMEESIAAVGNSFLLCTLTTSMGFFVFIPTDNLAIAELGLISGSGMIINLFVTVTLFPALLAGWLRIEGKTAPPPRFRLDGGFRRGLAHHPRVVAGVAFSAFALAAVAATEVRFDDNILNIRDPETVSVQIFEELVEESGERSPWPINAIAADLDAAEEMAQELEALDVVSKAIHLRDYVPEDQEDKLDILADLGFLLDTPPGSLVYASPRTTEAQVAALRTFRDYLRSASPERDSSMGRSMRLLADRLSEFLERVDADPAHAADALVKLESILLSGVPELFDRLRRATEVEEITLERLPESLKERMIAEDGRARVQIFPAEVLSTTEAFRGFADDVTAVVPTASGISVNVIALGRATRSSFRQAIALSLMLIVCSLFFLWRAVVPVVLVLTPLVMTAVGTIGVMAALDMPLNLMNVLVVPLLLGIGVDSGIHLVHRVQHPVLAQESLLETTTARAVFFSALTTAMSFGTLGFSSHRGMSGLGIALSIGMLMIVLCNLVVLPALIELRKQRVAARREG
ncbi:MAG: MMPL family transporter [Deltaproteobacteria bacterium]|nr:MMPL family transporter [Deltaproteobacteria bacterium]